LVYCPHLCWAWTWRRGIRDWETGDTIDLIVCMTGETSQGGYQWSTW
jgi:hypothetical protein